MKKRCALISLFLLISPFMIYSMEKEGDDSGLDSPDLCHLTLYAVEKGWVDKDTDLEKQLRKNEEEVKEQQEEMYGELLEMVLREGNLSKNDLASLRLQVLSIGTGLPIKQIRGMLKYPAAKKRAKKRKKEIELLGEVVKLQQEQLLGGELKDSKKSNNEKKEVDTQIEKTPPLSLPKAKEKKVLFSEDSSSEDQKVSFVEQSDEEKSQEEGTESEAEEKEGSQEDQTQLKEVEDEKDAQEKGSEEKVTTKSKNKSKKKHKKHPKKSKLKYFLHEEEPEVKPQEAPKQQKAKLKKAGPSTDTVAPFLLDDDEEETGVSMEDNSRSQAKTTKNKSMQFLRSISIKKLHLHNKGKK